MNGDARMMQIAKIFLQESRDGVDAMEASLLAPDPAPGGDAIDSIFRAVHSIKGGAATFGFTQIADFTHGLENLLEEMRCDRRPLGGDVRQVLLQCCDCVREMVHAAETGQNMDAARVATLNAEIARSRSGSAPLPISAPASAPASGSAPAAGSPTAAGSAPADGSEAGEPGTWRIRFEPVADLLRLRNEPTRMFAELAQLGTMQVCADLSRLPDLDAIDPEACYLSWDIRLTGLIVRAQLDDVFDWVDPGCRLEIHSQAADVASAASPPGAELPSPPRSTSPPAHKSVESGSIRVATQKLDSLINLVGELMITQSMLVAFADGVDAGKLDMLRRGLSQLTRNTRELQQSVMQIRMLPVSFVFGRFPRLVHDLSQRLGKSVRIKLSGEGTELDKTVLEKISDPLVHLVRNALDHGLETPETRRDCGKEPEGTIELVAFHEGSSIVIEVRDDGAGLDRPRILQKARDRGLIKPDQVLDDAAIDDLIFLAGFSTAEAVSEISGRGVGMDVVRQNINGLGGHVQLSSRTGFGSTVRIRLPLTLAILEGQLVRVGREIYVISLAAIVEAVQISSDRVGVTPGGGDVFRLGEDYLPLVRLREVLGSEPHCERVERGLLVVVEADGRRVGVLVDDLLAQQQVVIKSLESNFKPVVGIAGATILGDGAIALIIDVRALIDSAPRCTRSPELLARHAVRAA